jgi:RNA polymerase primary sigma factor
VVQAMLKEDLGALMERHLDPDEVEVLAFRFGLRDGTGRTIREVSEALGLTQPKVKRILFAAMNKMRRPHVAVALRDYLSSDTPD